MKYILENQTGTPAYFQLYRLLRDDIVQGIYPANTKLPSKRVMADNTGVSTITVEHAYALLSDEGYIESRERSGYFVIFCADDGFAVAAEEKLHTGVIEHIYTDKSEEIPFSVLAGTMRKVLSYYGEAILERSPNTGCTNLREAISHYLARSRGINAETEQIIIGSGSEYLYNLIVGLLGRNLVYAIEVPSYKKIEQVYNSSGVRLEKLPLGKDGIETASLRASTADVLHISPYRSFPSGVTASASKRHEYIRWAKECGRYIVEDDFESEFSVSKKPEETVFSHSPDNNVIYMNTFSKTVSQSFRIGYMVIPKCLVQQFHEKLGFYSCTVSTYLQIVFAELINNGDFERHINRIRRRKRKNVN